MIKVLKLEGVLIEIASLSNKGVRMTFTNYRSPFNKFNNKISVRLIDSENISCLIQLLSEFLTVPIKKEEIAYTEEINTFKDEVERSIFITGRKGDLTLSLDCYTNQPYDDNWVDLTPKRLSKLVGLLYGYL